VRPGPRHWEIFVDLCRAGRATGKLVPDAFHAAVAIEHGCEWVTTDADFSRFPGFRWSHPLRGG
jgi:predicted nucleic acid-binding protein